MIAINHGGFMGEGNFSAPKLSEYTCVVAISNDFGDVRADGFEVSIRILHPQLALLQILRFQRSICSYLA